MSYCCETILKPNIFNSSNKTNCKCSFKQSHYRCCVPPFSIQSYQKCSIVCPLKPFKDMNKQLCYSKKFRYFYSRGDLPCTIEHKNNRQSLKWFINDLNTLNIHYYLPIFFDGLSEIKYPYYFIALHGILDLIKYTSHKIDNELISKLIFPIKNALYTKNLFVIKNVLFVIQKLAQGNDGNIGISLVSYFNQLLPVINILKEYFYSNYEIIRLIDQTLFILEQYGGPDAFINIKYSIPTYEQQSDIKQLTSNQMNTFIKPILDK